jgi:hypothetical protein
MATSKTKSVINTLLDRTKAMDAKSGVGKKDSFSGGHCCIFRISGCACGHV